MRLVVLLSALLALSGCQVGTSQGMGGGMVFQTTTPVSGEASGEEAQAEDDAAQDDAAQDDADQDDADQNDADQNDAAEVQGGGAALTIGGGFGTGVSN